MYVVAVAPKEDRDRLKHVFLVINQVNRRGRDHLGFRQHLGGDRSPKAEPCRLEGDPLHDRNGWKIQSKRGPSICTGLELNVSVMTIHHLAHHCKSQTASSGTLGGEKRVEHVGLGFDGDAGPGVGNIKLN